MSTETNAQSPSEPDSNPAADLSAPLGLPPAYPLGWRGRLAVRRATRHLNWGDRTGAKIDDTPAGPVVLETAA